MNKVIITMVSIIIILTGIIIGAACITKQEKDIMEIAEANIGENMDEVIEDECTEEYEQMEREKIISANSSEEKISPNCTLIEETFYEDCGHIISNYVQLPEKLVNKTRSEVEEMYPNWTIIEFSNNKIILSQKVQQECGEHFLVRDREGEVVVYKILPDASEQEYEKTSITTEYLTETDKNNMKKGIYVNGLQNLNMLLEDYE